MAHLLSPIDVEIYANSPELHHAQTAQLQADDALAQVHEESTRESAAARRKNEQDCLNFADVMVIVRDISERKAAEAAAHTPALEHGIAERKRMEAEVSANLAKYRALLESIPVGVSITDDAGNLIESNREAARILGVSKGEHERRSCDSTAWQIVRRDGTPMPAAEYACVRALRENRRVENVTMGIIKGPDSITWIDVTAEPIAVPGYGVAIAYVDVSERTRTEELLRASEERYRKIVETAQEGIWVIDAEARTTFANPAMAAMLGYTASEMTGTPLFAFMDEEGKALAAYNLERRRQGIKETHEFKFMHKDGRPIWALLNTNPIQDEQGQFAGALAMVTDITERKHAEVVLTQYAAELERSNRDLEQFANVVSHDLQEPLRMVACYTHLLAQDYRGKLDADADEYIGYVVDGAIRMQQLIADLLAYSRIGTRGKPFAPVNVADVVYEVLNSLQLTIEETGAVMQCAALPTVMADRMQLYQLFQNLVANAIKYRGSAPPWIEIGADQASTETANDRLWRFWVRDNGIGIEPQYFERIFVIFQRLHARDEYTGTGIGLTICKKIVERHGGRIWVESEPGLGSTFYFTLPAV